MMNIKLHTIPIRDLVDGYVNNDEEGVVGYGGKLNIRPAYQREFVYDAPQQKAVINSIFKDFPLNVMYWVKNEQGGYELLDGQQRTLSICSYYNTETEGFSIELDNDERFFDNLTPEQKKQFLDYKLHVYICENGTDKERLDWFRIINIAGETLTDQELRNATYTGKWITSAKRIFSKTGCYAFNKGSGYLKGVAIRQEYLETVLKWACERDGVENVDVYMAKHQFDDDAEDLKQYFTEIVDWLEELFPDYNKKMEGLPWGIYYNKNKDKKYDIEETRRRAKELSDDPEVTRQSGVYEYILGGENDKSLLNLRQFDEPTKRAKYKEQHGKCAICGKEFEYSDMQGDHVVPWSRGGKTILSNCQMLCVKCNIAKSNH